MKKALFCIWIFICSSVFAGREDILHQWFRPKHRNFKETDVHHREKGMLRRGIMNKKGYSREKLFIKQIDTDRRVIKFSDKNVSHLKSGDTLGFITGTVTDIYGTPLKDIKFRVRNIADNYGYSDGSWKTDSLGHYTIPGTDWPLEFTSCKLQTKNSMGYIDEWYDNKYDRDSADVINVTFPDTAKNIDFELEIGGCISGYITSAGEPAEGIGVNVYDVTTKEYIADDATTKEYIADGGVNSTGYYIVSGLPTGSYKLETWWYFPLYIYEWYDNKPDFASADPVNVTAPDTVENINFELEIGGCISGCVTSNKGPLENVYVDVYDATTKNRVSYYFTDPTGYYIVRALPTGDYKVRTSNDKGFIDLYWNNKLDWDSADLVSVTLPDTVNNIDFALYRGAKIKGQVYGTEGPLESVGIIAFNSSSGEWTSFGKTDSLGSYTIDGLPTGDCKLFAFPEDNTVYAFEWYDNKDDWSSADLVYVTAPDSVVDKNFTLERGGFISGNVYEAKGPIEGTKVTAHIYLSPWLGWLEYWYDDYTGSDGSYKLINFRTGDYKVVASKGGYETRWWDNKPDSATASFVHVTMPDTTENIDFYLPKYGIAEEKQVVSEFSFKESYPNPFTRTTLIRYSCPYSAKVSLKIYDITGRAVETLVDRKVNAGHYIVKWDAKDYPSGIYFTRFQSESHIATRKIILIR